MYVSAGVRGVATVLQVVEPRVQSHYFLDQPCNLHVPWKVCTVMQSVFVAGCDGTSLSGFINFRPLDIGLYL